MQSLLDPRGSYLKSEKNVKKFLEALSDESIKTFYENIELTPFPILLAKEYHQRLSKKKKTVNPNKIRTQKNPRLLKDKKKKTKKHKDVPFRHGSGVKISKFRKR